MLHGPGIRAVVLSGAMLLGVPIAGAAAQVGGAPPTTAPGAAPAAPPTAPQGVPCTGQVVTGIDIYAHPPSYNGAAAGAYEKMEEVTHIRHVTTRRDVLRDYLRVRVGKPCTERDRTESERLLRAQPFISAASVRALPDSAGGVRLQVDVVDEIAIVLSGSIYRGTIATGALGSQNIAGLGLGITAYAQQGFAYRNGIGIHVIQYGMFGSPDYLSLTAEQSPHGDSYRFELAEPFLTDLQRRAFHVGATEASDYYAIIRPVGDPVALYVRRTVYDAGWVTRIGSPDRQRTIFLLGGAMIGEDVRDGDRAVIVSDTGLISAPDSSLDTKYPAFAVTRLAAIGGIRSIRFITVGGFDALRALQDVGVGVQVGLVAGPSLWASRDAADVFVAGDLYAGVGDANSFFAARVLGEARANREMHSWDGLVGSARLAWYTKPSGNRTRILSVEMSAIQHLSFPMQLTFRDADGGLAGYQDATAAGGQRVIARLEERRLFHLSSRADFGIAGFAEAGKLWAGDVPYGLTTGIRPALGFSLLGAYPAGGKRLVRVDFAVPLSPERGQAKFELRVSNTDRTGLLWREPRDVANARTGAVPSNLVKW